MIGRTTGEITAAAVAVMVFALALACGSSDAGLTRAEVEDIARSEVANAPAPDAGLTSEDVAEIAQAVVVMAAADNLTGEDVRRIARESVADAVAMTPGDGGLTRADVDEMIQAAMDGMPQPEPGLTRAEMELIVQLAIAGIPQPPEPDPGLTRAEVERIARAAMPVMPPPIPPEPSLSRAEVAHIAQRVAASIPPRSQQALYTKFFVDNAISIYDADGLEDTLAYYNTPESVDGQWYVFVIEEDGEIVGHYDADVRGQNLNGPLGTDQTGYRFGPDMLAAPEDGRWVSYVYNNPATGEVESKHSWVVRHDGLLIGSGWYADPASYTRYLVSAALDMYEEDGLEATLEAVNAPESVDGQWYVFVAQEGGEVIGHYDADVRGQNVNGPIGIDARGYDFGAEMLKATEEGKWVSYVFDNPATGELGSKHSWVVRRDDLLIGSGWYADPERYTRYLVEDAIERYESEGLDESVAYHKDAANIDGEWYVVILDSDGTVLSHYNPDVVGASATGPVGTDINGYNFGEEILRATEEGLWVEYVFAHPVDGRAGGQALVGCEA